MAESRSRATGRPGTSLDAVIAIVHGLETIADNSSSEAKMCSDFATWVRAKYPRGAALIAHAYRNNDCHSDCPWWVLS